MCTSLSFGIFNYDDRRFFLNQNIMPSTTTWGWNTCGVIKMSRLSKKIIFFLRFNKKQKEEEKQKKIEKEKEEETWAYLLIQTFVVHN